MDDIINGFIEEVKELPHQLEDDLIGWKKTRQMQKSSIAFSGLCTL
jgi:hypothetical protein